jgi:hypothetical protein
MKYGYATLLSELIGATECSYDDCKQFQIVCPECREPLFKVHREKDDIHFLSHYKKDTLNFETCELRVSQYNENKVKAFNKQSHEQSLKLFLAQFQGQLRALSWYPENPKKIKKIIKSNLLFNEYISYVLSGLENPKNRDLLLSTFKNTIFDFEGMEEIIKNEDRKKLAIQERIAFDVIKMLFTPKEKHNFIELSALTLNMMINKNIGKYANNVHRAMDGKLGDLAKFEATLAFCGSITNRREFDEWYIELSNMNLDGTYGANYFFMCMFELTSFILINIPYQKMLSHKSNQKWDSSIFMDGIKFSNTSASGETTKKMH